MSEIVIPKSVELRAALERRGIHKTDVIRAYLSPLLLQNEELDGFKRDKDGRLIAVTRAMAQPDLDIPAEFRPKRKK